MNIDVNGEGTRVFEFAPLDEGEAPVEVQPLAEPDRTAEAEPDRTEAPALTR